MNAAISQSSLKVTASWSLFGNVGYLATQWGVLTILVKSLDSAAVGLYSYGLALTAPLMVLASMRLRLFQATDATDEFRFLDFWVMRLISVALSLVLLIAVVVIYEQDAETRMVVWWIGVSKAIDLVSETCHGLWQKHERMSLIAISRILNGGGTLIAVAIAIRFTSSVPELVILSSLVSLLVLLSFNWYWVVQVLKERSRFRVNSKMARHLVTQIDWGQQWRLFILVAPLGLTAAVGSLDANLPRLVVEEKLGPSALGIFSALAYTTLATSTLVDAVGNAISPRLARLYQSGDTAGFNDLIGRLLAMGAAVLAVALLAAWLLGRPALALVYTSEYAQYVDLLLLLIVAAGIQAVGTVISFGMTATRNLKSQAYIQLITLMIGFGAYWYFTEAFGLLGAGAATVVAAAFRSGLLYLVSQRAMQSQSRSESVFQ